MANFALTLVHASNWDDTRGIREQADWLAHAAFMDGLVDDGFVLLGGPVGDGSETLHVVEAGDIEEVRTRMAADPWAVTGLLNVGSIRPWSLWLDFRNLGG